MKNQNPFMPGDRVVCIDEFESSSTSNSPKIGGVYTVGEIWHHFVGILGYTEFLYEWSGFAPIQDATDMEFEETEYAHYEEMTA